MNITKSDTRGSIMSITVRFLVHKDEKFNNKDKGMKMNITERERKKSDDTRQEWESDSVS
jgi:hypothetical protein